MESHHNPRFHFSFFIRGAVFVVSIANQRQHRPIDSRAWFDHVRDKALLGFLIEIIERLAAGLDMLLQIIIGAIRDPLQLLSPKGKFVFDVERAFGIKCALFFRHIQNVQSFPGNPDLLVKPDSLFQPVGQQIHPLLRPAKIFQLHLLKLARAEGEVPWINLVSKRFADLRDPERQFLA